MRCLLFRLGDFYEMFFEDAQAGAQLLNLALTARNGVPMCGLPHHASHAYIGRLLKAGRKVAICDQLEDARPGKLVKREVTQILSPGTHFDERMLVAERNNFLAAVYPCGKNLRPRVGGFDHWRFHDHGIGDRAGPADGTGTAAPGGNHLSRRGRRALRDLLRDSFKILNGYDDWTFAPETALYTVRDHFKVASLDGFGLKDRTAAIGAAGAALHYLTQHLRRDVKHLTRLSFYQPQRLSRAGLHDAAASGNPGAAASRCPAQCFTLRRGQPHRHADGRADAAQLAFAAAGGR